MNLKKLLLVLLVALVAFIGIPSNAYAAGSDVTLYESIGTNPPGSVCSASVNFPDGCQGVQYPGAGYTISFTVSAADGQAASYMRIRLLQSSSTQWNNINTSVHYTTGTTPTCNTVNNSSNFYYECSGSIISVAVNAVTTSNSDGAGNAAVFRGAAQTTITHDYTTP